MRYTVDYLIDMLPTETGDKNDQEKIQQMEKKLGTVLPQSYTSFLQKYSFLVYKGRTVLGISTDTDESFIDVTYALKQQINNFPCNMIVIESLGFDNIFILLDRYGKIYQYNLVELKQIYDTFEDYLLKDILDGKNVEIEDRVKAIAEVVIEQYEYHKEWVYYERLRLQKFYKYAFSLCYDFMPEELDVLSDEILRVEHALLNNSLKTIQNVRTYSKEEYLMCFVDIAYVLSSHESYLAKYLKRVVSEINAESVQESQLKEKAVSLLEAYKQS